MFRATRFREHMASPQSIFHQEQRPSIPRIPFNPARITIPTNSCVSPIESKPCTPFELELPGNDCAKMPRDVLLLVPRIITANFYSFKLTVLEENIPTVTEENISTGFIRRNSSVRFIASKSIFLDVIHRVFNFKSKRSFAALQATI